MAKDNVVEAIPSFQTHPDRYRHWKLSFEGEVARLSMDVAEEAGLRPEDYTLKLNSYDLGVDIELADAVQRIRFEHPEVRTVVVTSLKERIFCAGANIFMLGSASHPFKVNFCKYTNETRLSIEDASAHSGLKFLAALNGTASGGGYELALACDEILLIDDGNSAVSLPEVPLLGVLPGTGGLTRVVDKRKVRRDQADFFSTVAEGIKGRRAVEWRLVDQVVPKSRFNQVVADRAKALAAKSDRPQGEKGITLPPLEEKVSPTGVQYRHVTLTLHPAQRMAELRVKAPEGAPPKDPAALAQVGAEDWSLRAFRELDDALLRLRVNHLDVGTVVLKTEGDAKNVLAYDRFIHEHRDHWLVREVLHLQKRVLKRLDLTAKTLFAFIEPGSCFAGVLAELALASDRSYMLDDPDKPVTLQLGPLSAGLLPMSNGLSRLETRMLAEPGRVKEILGHEGPFDASEALAAGLVTFTPDDLDWEDEIRVALEERASYSPDALTGMEANLRFAGPETMETKIFGRLTAWQNWIFQRPNAVGERGALTLYGQAGQRPHFDIRRT
ncbi:MAG TPA: 2,3-epoxybenzoyl-CoA dihydrolase [Myxococcaceae bacterium]|nr:2,3-epoxybenzoyl-CoA dihydrolase [Myxococcaceae bacterium]